MSRAHNDGPACATERRRRSAAASTLLIALLMVGAAPARAAELPIGTPRGTELCSGGFVAADTGSVVPVSGGTITSFAYQTNADTGGQRLDFEVLRPTGAGRYTVVGHTGMQTLPADAGVVSFPASIGAVAGDVLGFYEEGLANCLRFGALGSVPSLHTGSEPAPGTSLNLGADIQGAALNLAATLYVPPPSTPAAPVPDRSADRDGEHALSWSSADPGVPLTYRLQRRRSDQAEFSPVSSLDALLFRFGADGPAEDEGTWSYRLIAVNALDDPSAPSAPSAPVKVDRHAPAAPSVTTSPGAPDAISDGVAWYRDSLRVGFASAGDPPLADGSPGSGVAAVTAPLTVGPADADPQTGAFTATGTATDRVGNISAARTVTGRLDWTVPTAAFTDCPGAPVLLHATRTTAWSAQDPAPSAGLATAPSGTVPLDTAVAGPRSVASPAPADAVRHVGTAATCRYDVVYAAAGFLAPVVDPPAVNTGRSGRTYPVMWQLRDAAGRPVGGLDAIRSITARATDCHAFGTGGSGGLPARPVGNTRLRYDSGSQRYAFDWASPGPGCYTLAVTLDSGQVLAAYFALA